MTVTHTTTRRTLDALDGPDCGHEACLFERDCLVIQAEAELADYYLDRAQRREMGLDLARRLGLGTAEAPLFEVAAYSPDLACRLAAAERIVAAVRRTAEPKAAA